MPKELHMDNGDVTEPTDEHGDGVVWPPNGFPIEGPGGTISCDCGNYGVMVPTRPKAISVTCPVCGDQFGVDNDE